MKPNLYTHAAVRPPGESYVNAISSIRAWIDVALARQQHSEYIQALRETGLLVDVLSADEGYPDSCFMQDPAVILDGVAIVGRHAVASRMGESELIAPWLEAQMETLRISTPGTLEGGDVLNIEGHVFVGETERTNAEGIKQLTRILESRGIHVEPVPVSDYLHLLTVVTYVGNGILVVDGDYADHPAFAGYDRVSVPPEEAYAANTLGIGDYAIVPAGFPHVAKLLRGRGFKVIPVPVSEFAKADGGVSCLALIR